MFRLEDRQLHMMIFLIFGVSLFLFCFFGVDRIPVVEEQGTIEGMNDFSDGWICTYKTNNGKKLEEYRSTEENPSSEDNRNIQEVVTFPDKLFVAKNETLLMIHKVPEIEMNTEYLILETDSPAVKVSIEQEVIYQDREKGNGIRYYYVIPVMPEYRDKVLMIELSGQAGNSIEIGTIYAGNRNQFWTEILKENGASVTAGVFLIGISFCLLVVLSIIKNTRRQKKPLLYSSLESMALGLLFVTEGKMLPILTGWNYGIHQIRACVIILMAILHLMLLRCFIYKKRVLLFLDMGIIIYDIFFISVIVLHAFSLVQFDTVYQIGKWMFGIAVLFYTIALAVIIYDYGYKKEKPVFYANAVLVFCMLAQIIMQVSGREVRLNNIYMPAGLVIYTIFMWILSLKQALLVVSQKEALPYDEEGIRNKIIEQLNPDLLFSSFHMLQTLIKNNSDKSIKMVYYIFVYIRSSIRVIEKTGEIIPFEEELEHMIAYIQLQKMQNANLNFTMECKVKDFHVPRHSIEPMIENAVRHGIGKHNNKGNIVIRTYLRAEGYAVQIIDDGIGFDKRMLKRQSPTALLNLFDLLEKTCQAKTEIITREGKGTVITIILPMLENELIDKPEQSE